MYSVVAQGRLDICHSPISIEWSRDSNRQMNVIATEPSESVIILDHISRGHKVHLNILTFPGGVRSCSGFLRMTS